MTVHKHMLCDTSIEWFGKACPGDVVKYVEERGSPDEVDAGIAVEDVSHEPAEFLSEICEHQGGRQEHVPACISAGLYQDRRYCRVR